MLLLSATVFSLNYLFWLHLCKLQFLLQRCVCGGVFSYVFSCLCIVSMVVSASVELHSITLNNYDNTNTRAVFMLIIRRALTKVI